MHVEISESDIKSMYTMKLVPLEVIGFRELSGIQVLFSFLVLGDAS